MGNARRLIRHSVEAQGERFNFPHDPLHLLLLALAKADHLPQRPRRGRVLLAQGRAERGQFRPKSGTAGSASRAGTSPAAFSAPAGRAAGGSRPAKSQRARGEFPSVSCGACQRRIPNPLNRPLRAVLGAGSEPPTARPPSEPVTSEFSVQKDLCHARV